MKIVSYIWILLLMMSCGFGNDIELPEQVELYVIEGWVTDQEGPQQLKISRTNSFLEPGFEIVIPDAQVNVYDNRNNIFSYTFNSNTDTYISDSSFVGQIGVFYRLQVVLGNQDTIQSQLELMRSVHEIDILTYDFYEIEDPENPGEELTIYYPVIFAEDPSDQNNFYQWNVYKNDSLFNDAADLILISDRFIDGSYYKNEFTSFELFEGDSLSIEVRSLSPQAFEYLSYLRNQTLSIGTSFGSSPGPLEGNCFMPSKPGTTVLGYFGANSIRRKGIIISE